MTKKSERLAEIEQARARLLELLKPGDTVSTIIRHVTRSGMYRVVAPVIVRDGEMLTIGHAVSLLTGMRWDDKYNGVGVDGCGMDVGFEVVYNLGRALWPAGFSMPVDTYHNGLVRAGEVIQDGGYALKQRWL